MDGLLKTLTPKRNDIFCNAQDRIISIHNRSCMEGSMEFYEPIVDWIENLITVDYKEEICIDIKLQYMNSSSSVVFFDVHDLIQMVAQRHIKMEIDWDYDVDNDINVSSNYRYNFNEFIFHAKLSEQSKI